MAVLSAPDASGRRQATVEGLTLTVDPQGEAKVRDLDFAAFLGFKEPRAFRKLIRRHEATGLLGVVDWRDTVSRQPTNAGGSRAYDDREAHLTEAQALALAAKSETKTARALLQHVIAVFIAVRRGLVAPPPAALPPEAPAPPPAAALPPATATALADELLYLRAQTARLEATLGLRHNGTLREMRERLERLEARAGLPAPSLPWPAALPAPGPSAALALRAAADPATELRAQIETMRGTLARLAQVVGFDANGRLPDFSYVPRVDWEATGVARVRAWMLDCTRPLSDDELRRQRGRWRGLAMDEVVRSFERWCAEQRLSGLTRNSLSRFLTMCAVHRWKTAGGVRFALALRADSAPAALEARHA